MVTLPDLYLMRHGQTHWNVAGRLQGALDSPLTDTGVSQARCQAQLTRDIEAVRVSSPQGRAEQTAAIVFEGRAWHSDPRLSEIGIGSFAGQDAAKLRAENPRLFRDGNLSWYDHCPGGEGLAALQERCRDFLKEHRAPTIVVTHGVTLAMLFAIRTGRNFATIGPEIMRQGIVLHLTGRRFRILQFSGIDHSQC
ncbi:histidine phosphatase family protein [Paracoccus indicus]|uniref:histidine phosphatase family protein n=1 Tax=Paracoccus indicus TaxID=2079229 RepID=UPI000D38642F|nr:histidine phosphatase family protein [Paracoccus indicus]